MLGGHGQNYLVDTIAFGLSTLPVVFVGILILTAIIQEKNRGR